MFKEKAGLVQTLYRVETVPREGRGAVNPSSSLPRYSTAMLRVAIPLLLIAAPALAGPPPHSGIPTQRSMPELSDLALFAVAAGGVWFVRRAMRARFRRTPKD